MVLQIISWYKFFVRRIDGLTKTSKLQLETRPTFTAIALPLSSQLGQISQSRPYSAGLGFQVNVLIFLAVLNCPYFARKKILELSLLTADAFSTVGSGNRGSTSALRCSTLDFCLDPEWQSRSNGNDLHLM